MLTPSLQEIRLQIEDLFSREKSIRNPSGDYVGLLNVIEQIDLFEAELSKAYEEGGLSAASRVIIRPAESNCQICGRAVISKIS